MTSTNRYYCMWQVLVLLLSELDVIFQAEIRVDTDEDVAKEEWDYVVQSILKLQDKDSNSVWDERLPLSNLFESTDMGSELFAWSKDIHIDAKEAKNLFKDIYGPMGDKKLINEAIPEIIKSSCVKVCK